MTTSSNKESMRQSCSEQDTSKAQKEHINNLSDYFLFELKEWIQHVINIAEKNGDLCKRNRFLALRAKLL